MRRVLRTPTFSAPSAGKPSLEHLLEMQAFDLLPPQYQMVVRRYGYDARETYVYYRQGISALQIERALIEKGLKPC